MGNIISKFKSARIDLNTTYVVLTQTRFENAVTTQARFYRLSTDHLLYVIDFREISQKAGNKFSVLTGEYLGGKNEFYCDKASELIKWFNT